MALLKRLSITNKLFFAFLLLTVIVIAIASAISFQQSRGSLEKAAFDRLTSVREMKAFQIEEYLEFIGKQVVTFSKDSMVVNTMRDLEKSFHDLEAELAPNTQKIQEIDRRQEEYYQNEFMARLAPNLAYKPSITEYLPRPINTRLLQHLYVSGNPNETGSKDLLNDAGDTSTYSRLHREVHPIFRDFLQQFGYYDIFLLDNHHGDIVYTVFKEVDVGTSLVDGPYADTGLGRVFRMARNARSHDFVAVVDFEAYHPSYNRPAAFIASPIFENDEQIGVLAFQMPIDRINRVMTNDQNWADVGLGESGESYIVAQDYKLRNQSRFLIEDGKNYFRMIEEVGTPSATIEQIRNLNSTVGLQEVRTEGTLAALSGQSDTRIFDDYRGVSVLSSFRPLNIEGLDWVIMSEIDEAEALASIGELGRKLALTAVLLVLFAFAAAMVFSRTITRPVARLSESSRALANGNLETEINTNGIDEIGDLARDFENMRLALKKMVKELEEANAGLEQRVAERTAELESSEQKIKAIIESAAEAILVVDENMEILLWNPGAAQMFGYTAEEARGRSIMEFVPEAYRAGHAAGFSNVSQTGSLKHPGVAHELSALGAGGREIPIELSLGTWEIGGKRYFSALIRDVTERKELEDKIELANRRMLEELSFARDIQMGMLPLLFPAFPERAELALDAVLEPAREVGGDFYDFYFLDENRLCLVVADVSGKGAPAALFMAVSKTLIKSRAANDFDPASILTQVNGELAENNTTSTFVTVFLAILDVTTGALQFCNAGHNPPFVKNSKGALQRLEALHGPILGVLPGLEYSKDTVILEPGDMLVMYTDGVTEAMNEKEEEYSDQRLADLLAKSGGQIPNELTLEILEDVRSHQGSAEQSDDITLLAAKYQGRVPDEKGHMEIHILNRSPEISVVEEKFHDYATGIGVPDTDRQTLSMVIDDLLNNVISYAYPEGGDHQILVDVTLRGARLVLMIEDDGIPFNPFETEQPDVGQSVEERGIGGLGIHLVRETMDEYHYQRRADKNIVILVKNLDALNEQETAGESVNEPQSE